jgi:exodeoxyribonuclease V alpha subunit
MMEIETLLLDLMKPLKGEEELFKALITSFCEGHFAMQSNYAGDVQNPFVVKENNYLYMKKNHDLETKLLNEIKRLFAFQSYENVSIADAPLQEGQKRAVELALKYPFSIITGGPGTGKTYTAGYLMRFLLQKSSLSFVIAAPTGKACAQLKQSLEMACADIQLPHHRVLTLHSLLEPGKENRLPLIPEDLVIVDEASMIDIEFFIELFSRIKPDGRLILLGDPNQLPPVESGAIFPEIVDIFRKMGRLGQLETTLRAKNSELISYAKELLEGRISFPIQPLENFSMDHVTKETRLLTPVTKGPYGVSTLNKKMFERIESKEIPIMITRNDYQQKLFNGETGTLYLPKRGEMNTLRQVRGAFGTFYVDGEAKIIPAYELPPFDLAYAMSIHKSQGSAFDHPILLLPKGSSKFGKELLYTALTRSKMGIDVFGDLEEIQQLLKSSNRPMSTLFSRF